MEDAAASSVLILGWAPPTGQLLVRRHHTLAALYTGGCGGGGRFMRQTRALFIMALSVPFNNFYSKSFVFDVGRCKTRWPPPMLLHTYT